MCVCARARERERESESESERVIAQYRAGTDAHKKTGDDRASSLGGSAVAAASKFKSVLVSINRCVFGCWQHAHSYTGNTCAYGSAHGCREALRVSAHVGVP